MQTMKNGTFSVVRNPFGRSKSSQEVEEYVLECPGKKITCKVVTYGATLTSVQVPDRNGNVEEITVCYSTLDDLEGKLGPYYGCIAGRYANRIRKGQFALDGESYQLAINNGPNALHGGLKGFDKQVWSAEMFLDEKNAGVKMSYRSPDGEEGYPGELLVEVAYSLNDDGQLEISYHAETHGKATPINLTNHTYWNLSGNCSRKIYDHRLELSCDRYLPVDDTQIPLGELAPVEGTAFDLRTDPDNTYGKLLRDVILNIDGGGRPGLDHCFVVDGALEDGQTMSGAEPMLRLVALLTDETSGRQLICEASQPGVQVYSANWLSEPNNDSTYSSSSIGETDHPHTQHNGICLETQHFPDSVNQPQFPSAILRPGETYRHKTIMTFECV